MKARLPKEYQPQSGNMNKMLQQAQQAQEDMNKLQAELDEREYNGESGGGAVKATVTGAHRVTAIRINPEIVDPEDVEMIEDMVAAAVNEAMRIADETAEEEMSKITSGLNLPI